jgi:hypothetical protein
MGLMYPGYRGSLPEIKWPERDANHSSLSSPEASERVVLSVHKRPRLIYSV